MFDYESPQNNIRSRIAMPEPIRKTLLESTRSDWENHPRYHGMASFLAQIHRGLIEGAGQMSRHLEQMLDLPETEIADALGATRLPAFGRHLIDTAHHHHEIEDTGYFPQFMQLYPQLEHGMKMLDGDHRILDASLDETGAAISNLSRAPASRDGVSDVYAGSKKLSAILKRHINDEEEIVMPILLRHT